MQLSEFKGIGPKRLKLLAELHIQTTEDLLRFYPRSYLDCTQLTPLCDLQDGTEATVSVTLSANPTIFYSKGRHIVSVRAEDETGKVILRWMNQPYRMQQMQQGQSCILHGRVSKKRGTVLYNPQIVQNHDEIRPIYALPKGLTQACIRDAVSQCLKTAVFADIPMDALRDRYGYIPFMEAISEVHRPSDTEKLLLAKQSLAFEDAVLYFLAVSALKERHQAARGYPFSVEGLKEAFLEQTPFQPTEAQLRVMDELNADLQAPHPMNRLLQGDVGSGKTLLAEYALFVALHNGRQSAMLAPTEILALQHFETLCRRFSDRVVLLIGSQTASEKREALERIRSEHELIVVGTHAVLSEGVHFADLGLVVTDEQHRFGVAQRAKMEQKGIRPDVLVMSATPIPRTLALLLYADLSLSVLDELPKGRQKIRTGFVPPSKRMAMYRYLAEAAQKDERTYVVCPLIDAAEGFEGLSVEEISTELRAQFPTVGIGVLHGRMKDEEKRSEMERFRRGETSILVSTTVIEVGVDVKDATAIVIEGADRFGLATLHQLRGRVGRGSKPSSCYLLSAQPSQTAKERLQTILSTTDGFVIAERDMEIRGHGDLFGVRQSGESGLHSLHRDCDYTTLRRAAEAAEEVFSGSTLMQNAILEEAVRRYGAFCEVTQN